MEKKEMKMYEAPAVEVVEVEAQGVICGSSGELTGEPDVDDWA